MPDQQVQCSDRALPSIHPSTSWKKLSGHLAINLVQHLPRFSGGIETYAHELIPRLIDRLPNWRVTAYVNSEGAREYSAWDDRCEWVDAGLSWHDRAKRLIWESTVLPRRVRRDGPTLLHNMTNTACLRPGCPQVTSIFDATQIVQPSSSLPSVAFRKLLRSAARRSDAVLTISESAADEISRAFSYPRDEIHVALLAARAANPSVSASDLESRFGIGDSSQFFLTPAARRPNKNIPALLNAFANLNPDSRPRLVLVGADGGQDDELNSQIIDLGLSDDVQVTGWVSDEELDSLYSRAVALVFPSLMEGFGLPILEAMQCGCPVVTSDVSSMPEVGGDAAVYFDPHDVDSITTSLQRVIADADLRSRMASSGLRQAARFSWDHTAEQTIAVYHAVVQS